MSNTSMASMEYLNAMSETTLWVCSGRDPRPRCSFPVYSPRMSLDYAASKNSIFGSLRKDCERCPSLRIWRVRARGEGLVEGEGGDKIDDPLEATIEKSKKVLATQKNLLQRVIFFAVLFLSGL